MSGHDHGAAGFEQLARQYWSAFGDFARQPTPDAGIPGWKEGLAWWTQRLAPGSGQLDDALSRMNAQVGDWYGLMQQVAAGFAGRDASPDQIGKAWQRAVGDAFGGAGIADLFKRMAGPGAQGFEHWFEQVQPFLRGFVPPQGDAMAPLLAQWQRAMSPQAWQEQFAPMFSRLQGVSSPQAVQDQLAAALRLPTFGLAREHQERWQAFAQAQLDYQQANAAFTQMLGAVGKRAFERFESRLEERSEPGRQLDTARALFDLWIDAAEDAWQEIALTEDFRRTYATLANTQMRVRAAVQTEIEQLAGLFGLPTRTEMDASHRKVAALERELRKLRSEIEEAAFAAQGGARRAASRAPVREAVVDAAVDDVLPEDDNEAPAPARAARARSAAAPRPAAKKKSPPKRKNAPAKRSIGVLPTVSAPRALGKSGNRKSRK